MPAALTPQILEACEKAVGYRFQDQRFLTLALTHASTKSDLAPSNERLEFLGDSVLGLVIADHLYRIRPDYDEGDCTEVKSAVVSRETLSKVTLQMNLLEYCAIGRGIFRHGGVPVSVAANLYEAIVGGIYLDGGLGHARRFILNSLRGEIEPRIGGETVVSNAKSTLQQQAQKRLGSSPSYRVLREFGPSHAHRFEVAVLIRGQEYGRGEGANKKEAEMRSAEAALKALEGGGEGGLPADAPRAEAKPARRGGGRGRVSPKAGAESAPAAPADAAPVVVLPLPEPPPSFGAGILEGGAPAASGGAGPKKRRRRGRRGGRGRGRKGPTAGAPPA